MRTDTVARGQRGTCHITNEIPAGNFVLEVTTFGLVGETKPRVFKKNVKVNAYAPPLPTVTNVKQEDLEPNVVWFTGGTMRITGERLAEVTGVKLQAEIDGATVENDITEDIETKTDTELVSYENGFENHSGKQDSKWSEKPAKLILVKGEDRVEYDVTFGSDT